MRRPSSTAAPLLPLAAAAGLLIAACGDDTSVESEGGSSTTGGSSSTSNAEGATSAKATTMDTDSSSGSGSGSGAEGTTGPDLGACADEVGPGVYECPPHARLVVEGGAQASCLFEGLTLPDADGLFAYCLYFDMGYLGFGWDLPAAPGYACPEGMRYAPNDTIGYCLFEDLVPPAGATATCDDLLRDGVFGFTWTCAA